jgi:hypothetical protein
VSTPDDRPGPDTTAAELRKVRAEIDAIRKQVVREQETREHRHAPPDAPDTLPAPPVTLRARLAAWLAGESARHDHNAEVRASRRRWRIRRRDSESWKRHHGGSP